MNVTEAILQRRTHKQFGGGPVDREVLEQLLDLAHWAPNHRLTNPWRFAVLDRDALDRFQLHVETNAEVIKPGGVEAIRAKLANMVAKMGALIVVGCAHNLEPKVAAEDRDTCACACQNILLGATERGLASFWSTGALFCSPKSREFYGFVEDVEIIGAICLGTKTGAPKSTRVSLSDKVKWL